MRIQELKNMECIKDSKEETIVNNAGRSAISDFIEIPRTGVSEKRLLNLSRNSY